MKRIYLITVITLFISSFSMNAQSYIQKGANPGSGDIYHMGGNIGIGTELPTQKLEIKDGSIFVHGSEFGQGRVVMRYDGSGGNQFEWYPTDIGLELFNRTTYKNNMIIANNGHVGIGTDSPNAFFHINKSTNDYWTAKITNSGGSAKGLIIKTGYSGNTSPILQLADNSGNVRMSVQSNGKIGIGTELPTQKLEIKDGSIFVHGSEFGQGRVVMRYDGSGGNQFEWYPTDIGLKLFNRTTYKNNMIIANNGHVGIGTDSPNAFFHINKSTNDYWTAKITNSGGSAKGLIIKTGYSGNTSPILQLADNSGNVRMSVQSNGKIGIGTTSPGALLEINKGINDIWLQAIKNGGGDGKGLLIQSGWGGSPSDFGGIIMRLDDYAGNPRMIVYSNGKVNMYNELWVKNEIIVQNTDPWADYVFDDDYKLLPLYELETYINSNKHLPEVPSAEEVSVTGVELAKMNTVLLKKVEELTLYTIEQQKAIDNQLILIEELREEMKNFKTNN